MSESKGGAPERAEVRRHDEATKNTARENERPIARSLARLADAGNEIIAMMAAVSRDLEAQPDSVSLLCRRASLLMAQQKFDLAEVDLRRAVKLNDASAEVQLNLGILHCKRARWREAITPLEAAVELDPSRATSHYFLAEAYNQTDRTDEALAQYETVVHLEPDNWRALKGVGIVLDKMGRPAEATLAYKRAREVQRR